MRNKRLMFLKKISNLDNFVNSSDESVRLAKLIIEEIDKAYDPPEGSKIDGNKIEEGTRAAEEMLSLDDDQLKEIQNSLDMIEEMEGNSFYEKEAGDYIETFVKLSYFYNLKKLNDIDTASYLYKNTFKKLAFEDVKLDKNKSFKKISIDLSNLDNHIASDSIEAFELTKKSFLGGLWNSVKNFGLKSLPFIGIPFVLYNAGNHIKQSLDIWNKELSQYNDIGSIQDLCSEEYMLNYYNSNKNDLHIVLRTVKAIKSSSSFILNFLMSIVSLVDLVETIITLPMQFTWLGILLEIAFSFGWYFAGSYYSETQANDMLDILKVIRTDMEKIINSKS